jgi:hypothetical protein
VPARPWAGTVPAATAERCPGVFPAGSCRRAPWASRPSCAPAGCPHPLACRAQHAGLRRAQSRRRRPAQRAQRRSAPALHTARRAVCRPLHKGGKPGRPRQRRSLSQRQAGSVGCTCAVPSRCRTKQQAGAVHPKLAAALPLAGRPERRAPVFAGALSTARTLHTALPGSTREHAAGGAPAAAWAGRRCPATAPARHGSVCP